MSNEIFSTEPSVRHGWPHYHVEEAHGKNAREYGMFLVGSFQMGSKHGERGFRVEVPEEFLGGVLVALIHTGWTVVQYTGNQAHGPTTIDVYADDRR